MQKIRVKLKGYDHKVVDRATNMIITTVENSGAKVVGPIPLPNRNWRVAVHKGPHIDGNFKDHFRRVTHSRVVDILDANSKTIESLTHLQLPAGVWIEIRN
ncbi:MAG: 30S ribosomal protein S10 [Candidatus Doudnabacteria bacterium]|nr:30S ribosomal protein S10 [Candidatus Doudnabacteria bacterium]